MKLVHYFALFNVLLQVDLSFQDDLKMDHFCQKLQTKPDSLQLQSLSATNSNIILIESDQMYQLQRAYLDTDMDCLFMFDRDNGGQLVSPQAWYTIEWMRVFDQNQNSPDTLLWFNLMESGTTGRMYLYYLMTQTYYLVLNDSTAKKTDFFDSLLEPLSFSSISDSGKGGYIFGFGPADSGKRVMLTPMLITEKANKVHINFPALHAVEKYQLPIDTPYYFLETNEDRTNLNIQSSNVTSQPNSKHDFFLYPPPGLMTSDKIYLLGMYTQRVYVIERNSIAALFGENGAMSSLESVPFKRIPWKTFFRCNPKQSNITDNNDENDMSQPEYYQKVSDLEFHPKKWSLWWIALATLFCSIMLAFLCAPLFFYVKKHGFTTTSRTIMARMKRRNKRKQRRQRRKSKQQSKSNSKTGSISSSLSSASSSITGKMSLVSPPKQPVGGTKSKVKQQSLNRIQTKVTRQLSNK